MSSHSPHLSPSSSEAVRVEYDFMSNQTLGLITALPPTPPEDQPEDRPRPKKCKGIVRIDWEQKEKWKDLQEPFLHLPAEIHLLIFALLNPIDAVCLSLVNKYIYSLAQYSDANATKLNSTIHSILSVTLSIGAPDSACPVVKPTGCKHCTPVLYQPAHCELSFHLKSFMPGYLKYCAGPCQKYTPIDEPTPTKDSNCSVCGTSYWKRFERGRRHIDMQRPGERQTRLRKWYNDDVEV